MRGVRVEVGAIDSRQLNCRVIRPRSRRDQPTAARRVEVALQMR
jgi:hypothetical protein